ncbi:acyl-CoA dehydrogenase [Pseudomonadota bacterium]
MSIFWMLVALAVIWFMAIKGVAMRVWSLVVAAILLIDSMLCLMPSAANTIGWIFLLAIIVPLNITSLRRSLFTDRILPVLRGALPPMSQTEKDALDAGTVWWDGDLFSGNPDWQKMLDIKAPKLTEDELAFLDGPAEELCKMLDDWHITEERRDLPPNVWQFIKDNGFFGMIIPKEYGGLQFSALAHSQVVMKISSRSVSSAVTIMVPNSLGPAELLMHYGTQEQKEYYLPRLAKGKEVPCFALTGPNAGSDAASIPDVGIVCKGEFEGKEVLGMRVTWEKRYITLGPVATVLGLAFKVYDPDHLMGTQEAIGITCALIPTNTPGVNIGNRHAPLSQAFMNGPNSGKDVFIPMEWVIGGQDKVGHGWRMLMECLAAGRSISLPSLSVGAGKLASRATGAYSRIRTQFNMPIGKFEGVEEPLALIAANTYMMDAARTMTAGAVDLGEKPSVISAIAKYNLTERMRKVVSAAMDIQGGSAICMGPRNFIGRVYQSVPISITVEGANILTRSMIIFGQGAVRCHPYILKEMKAAQDPDKEGGARDFDEALIGHIGFTIGNAARTFWLGLTNACWAPAPSDAKDERYYYKQASRMSAAFALVADVSMLTMGGDLKRKEKLSGRLADMLSQLYLISATLKHFHDQGRPSEDLPLLQWACDDALYQMQESLRGLLRNLPMRPLAAVLKYLIMPWGKSYHLPEDRLGHKVASLLLSPSDARDRLTKGVFVPTDEREQLGRIEAALKKVISAEAIERKLRSAIKSGVLPKLQGDDLIEQGVSNGVINSDEAKAVREAIAARRDVIMVDDFAPDYWQSKE